MDKKSWYHVIEGVGIFLCGMVVSFIVLSNYADENFTNNRLALYQVKIENYDYNAEYDNKPVDLNSFVNRILTNAYIKRGYAKNGIHIDMRQVRYKEINKDSCKVFYHDITLYLYYKDSPKDKGIKEIDIYKSKLYSYTEGVKPLRDFI